MNLSQNQEQSESQDPTMPLDTNQTDPVKSESQKGPAISESATQSTSEVQRGLVYLGMIVELQDIPAADSLLLATTACRAGGTWRGIVRKGDFKIGDRCNVYLPDSIVPQEEKFEFLRKYHFRVRQMRLRGCPSECLIMPYEYGVEIGDDVTTEARVVKYYKQLPMLLRGTVLGRFPAFLPKTDEENFQRVPHVVDYMLGRNYYATEKADGTSCTAYFKNGHFGVCSRNLELVEDDKNIYWMMAHKYGLDKKIPAMGQYAVQMEIVGPGIQGNPMGLHDNEVRVFDVINLEENRWFGWLDIYRFCIDIDTPTVQCYIHGYPLMMNHDMLQAFVEDKTYANGHPVEGAVFRTVEPEWCLRDRASFKVLNLKYKEKE